MKYPKHDIYEAMYSKYLDEASLKILMDLAGEDMSNKKVIDLCCGTGICTDEALRRNAKYIMMLDSEMDMIPDRFTNNDKIIIFFGTVEVALSVISGFDKYDIATCRQAVNYWLNDRIVPHLALILNKGGVFVFNTFNTRPTDAPRIKQYHHKGISFTEISYINPDDMVHHVQIRQNYPPHMATFKWIPPEEFDRILSPYFNIAKTTRNKTDYYRCVKK